MATIEMAIQALKSKSIAEPSLVKVPTRLEIERAERELSITFPPTFLRFLETGGAYQLRYWETYWVGGNSLGFRNIIKANHFERTEVTVPLPKYLVAFHNNGCGDQLCFDTRYPYSNGEYPIVFWDHELSVSENIAKDCVVANSFADWLMREANNTDE